MVVRDLNSRKSHCAWWPTGGSGMAAGEPAIEWERQGNLKRGDERRTNDKKTNAKKRTTSRNLVFERKVRRF